MGLHADELPTPAKTVRSACRKPCQADDYCAYQIGERCGATDAEERPSYDVRRPGPALTRIKARAFARWEASLVTRARRSGRAASSPCLAATSEAAPREGRRANEVGPMREDASIP